MDRNGDGSVDKKELFSWILRSFRSLSQEESTDRFHDTDEDQVQTSLSLVTRKLNEVANVKIKLKHYFSSSNDSKLNKN